MSHFCTSSYPYHPQELEIPGTSNPTLNDHNFSSQPEVPPQTHDANNNNIFRRKFPPGTQCVDQRCPYSRLTNHQQSPGATVTPCEWESQRKSLALTIQNCELQLKQQQNLNENLGKQRDNLTAQAESIHALLGSQAEKSGSTCVTMSEEELSQKFKSLNGTLYDKNCELQLMNLMTVHYLEKAEESKEKSQRFDSELQRVRHDKESLKRQLEQRVNLLGSVNHRIWENGQTVLEKETTILNLQDSDISNSSSSTSTSPPFELSVNKLQAEIHRTRKSFLDSLQCFSRQSACFRKRLLQDNHQEYSRSLLKRYKLSRDGDDFGTHSESSNQSLLKGLLLNGSGRP